MILRLLTILILLLPSLLFGQLVTWKNWDRPDAIQVWIRIYSTTNVTYSQDKIYDALTWIVRTYNTPAWSTNSAVQINLHNIIPVTPDMLPPYKTWSLYAVVPVTNRLYKIPINTKQQFFIFTATNIWAHWESDYCQRP